MVEDKLMMRRSKMAATRKIQRIKQQQQQPAKYEKAKLKNRVTSAKYDKKQRNKKKLMSKEEVLADRKMKAMARKNNVIKKNSWVGSGRSSQTSRLLGLCWLSLGIQRFLLVCLCDLLCLPQTSIEQ